MRYILALILVASAVCGVSSTAQTVVPFTNNVVIYTGQLVSQPSTVTSVTIQPVQPFWYNGTFFSADPQTVSRSMQPQLTNGSVYFTNLVCGIPCTISVATYYSAYSTNLMIAPPMLQYDASSNIIGGYCIGSYVPGVGMFYANNVNSATATNLSGNALVQATNIANGAAAAQGAASTNFTLTTSNLIVQADLAADASALSSFAATGTVQNANATATVANGGSWTNPIIKSAIGNTILDNGGLYSWSAPYIGSLVISPSGSLRYVNGAFLTDSFGNLYGFGNRLLEDTNGVIQGNGSGLTNIPASAIAGTVATASNSPAGYVLDTLVSNLTLNLSGSATGNISRAGSVITLNIGATNPPSSGGGVTYGNFVTNAFVPQPFAWYDASSMTDAQGAAVSVWHDSTGNTNNDLFLWDRYSFGGNTLDKQVMNGRAGVVGNVWRAYTNTCFPAGVSYGSNTVFVVYRDTSFDYGLAFYSGGIDFEPTYYQGTSQAYNGHAALWRDLSNNPLIVNTTDNGAVQVAAFRNGGNEYNRFDPTAWQNGIVSASKQNFTSIGKCYLSNSICLFSSPTAASASGYYYGSIGEVLVYTNALSDIQVAAVHNYLFQKYGLQKRTLAIVGASETCGSYNNGRNPLSFIANQLPNWTIGENAGAGRTSANCYSNLAQIANSAKLGAGSIIYYYQGGNDSGYSLATITNNIVKMANLCATNGYAFVLATLYSQYSPEVTYTGARSNFNAWVYATATSLGAYVLDWASDPDIGAYGSYTNGYWMINDGQHPTNTFYQLKVPPAMVNVVSAVQSLPPGSIIYTVTPNPPNMVLSNSWAKAAFMATNRLLSGQWAYNISSNGVAIYKANNNGGTITFYAQ